MKGGKATKRKGGTHTGRHKDEDGDRQGEGERYKRERYRERETDSSLLRKYFLVKSLFSPAHSRDRLQLASAINASASPVFHRTHSCQGSVPTEVPYSDCVLKTRDLNHLSKSENGNTPRAPRRPPEMLRQA